MDNKVYSRSVDVLEEGVAKGSIEVEASRVQREVLVGVIAERHILSVAITVNIDFGGRDEGQIKRVHWEVVAAVNIINTSAFILFYCRIASGEHTQA